MEILRKVQTKELSVKQAYKKLYKQSSKKARFICLRINLKEHFFISLLVRIFFLFPFPLIILKPFISKFLKEEGISPNLYNQLLESGKGIKINIITKDAKIRIKVI